MYYLELENGNTINLNDKESGIFLLNVIFNTPEEDVNVEYVTDRYANLPVVSNFSREFKSIEIEVKLLIKINKNSTVPTYTDVNLFYKYIKDSFTKTAYLRTINRRYIVSPKKILIETLKKNSIVFSLFFYSIGTDPNTSYKTVKLENGINNLITIGNNMEHFKITGELNNSNLIIKYKQDNINPAYGMLLNIPINITGEFLIDTENEIYTINNENILDISHFKDSIRLYNKMLGSIGNNLKGFNKVNLLANFQDGDVYFQYKPKFLY